MARGATSPLRLLLCAVFLFSAHVFAVSAVLGIDLGTEYIKAALVKPGIPLEIVLTKDSRRKETSAVAFKPSSNGPKAGHYPERLYGSDAVALAARYPGDVYPNLKTLLGLPTDHAAVKEYAARHPGLQIVAHKLRGTAAFKSAGAFTPEEEAWMVEELLAMELQSIRANAEALAGPSNTVRSVVITAPPFYTVEEKRALELAADLAGLRVLSLISDGMAVGLNYATTRQFPNVVEGGKPEYHLVFDMGAGSTKATVMRFQSRTVKDVGKFNKTVQEVQVLGSGWDRTLGGDSLNYLIVDDMVSKFVESPKGKKASVNAESVKAHGRAIAKLNKEAERLRHVLSANQEAHASFEGLYEDVDFKYKLTRAQFETLAEAHTQRVATAINDALGAASLKVSDLDSIILHGGASRTPFVQKALEQIVGDADKIRTNVNSDEAAVFGAGFRAAEISPSFRVKEIRISDIASYPAGMRWSDDKQKARHQRLWTATSVLGAAPKEVTFSNREDFAVTFYQTVPGTDGPESTVEAETKVFTTKNLTATVGEIIEKHGCNKSDIQFKVAVRLAAENGEVEVTKAALECEAFEAEKEGFVDGVKNLFGFGKKDQKPLEGEGSSTEDAESSSTESPSSETSSASTTTSTTSSSASASASESADSKSKSKTKKLIVQPVEYSLEKAGVPSLPKADITALKDRIKAFEASDRSRRQREEILNQLEGFTYKVRDYLDNEEFVAAATAQEKETLEKKGLETSEWLYEEGPDASREELSARLKALRDIVNPIQKRIEEASKRPELIASLKDQLNSTKTFVENIKQQIEEYEAFQASASIASSASTASTNTETTTATPAPSVDDFADLEDEDSTMTSTTKSLDVDDALKEAGPVPPLYTREDLKETEELHVSVLAWLEAKIVEQEKLGPTDDPVLLSKELTDKKEKLDKAGMDLAMKGVRNFEGKNKKAKTKKAKASKTAKAKKPAQTIKIGEDGKMPSEEEIEELLKQYRQADDDDKASDKGRGDTGKGKKKAEDEVPKHEEL
ncbi:Actin-like ATPase domain-containing protein [Coniochaeta hoffmannii]|uniref:Actin-like ATPase domain-containing protein n=1 Tax=Coniochaeta hoffmannii TaxID=91930 RepID=A0AA38S267_9PEZI|nr:Actin-like ATPase domain-containing protein [Coniochaeta hoffmannii]